MASVTGEFVQPDGTPFPTSRQPLIEVVPSKNVITVRGETVPQETQESTPNSTTGAYTVDLIPTVDVLDAGFHYTIRGSVLNPNFYKPGSGLNRKHIFEHKLYVPTAGGDVGTLAVSKGRPVETWVVVDPAFSDTNLPWPIIPGVLYLSAHPTDPNLGTGQLWKAVP